jgi:hypothetical protein
MGPSTKFVPIHPAVTLYLRQPTDPSTHLSSLFRKDVGKKASIGFCKRSPTRNPMLWWPLSSATRLMIADLSLARSMGDAGRRHGARFTRDNVARQMEDLYNSLKHPVYAFGARAPANA